MENTHEDRVVMVLLTGKLRGVVTPLSVRQLVVSDLEKILNYLIEGEPL